MGEAVIGCALYTMVGFLAYQYTILAQQFLSRPNV